MEQKQQFVSDMLRLSRSKQTVDISPNTIRKFARRGLNLYRQGSAVFFSRAELEDFIKRNGAKVEVAR